jgi:outer membrane lipoprotein-sorting protein
VHHSCWWLLSAIALAAHDPSTAARELLARSGGAALTAHTVRLEGMEQTELVAPGLRETVEVSFSLWVADGGRMRWQRKTGDSDLLQIADGRTVWTYLPATKNVSQTPERVDVTADVIERLKFGRDAAHFHDPQVEREETVAFGGRQVECSVVRANYASMPGFPAARGITRSVWIAKDTYLVLRDTWEFSMNAGAALAPRKSHITTDYTRIEWGVPLARERFEFHAPTGR